MHLAQNGFHPRSPRRPVDCRRLLLGWLTAGRGRRPRGTLLVGHGLVRFRGRTPASICERRSDDAVIPVIPVIHVIPVIPVIPVPGASRWQREPSVRRLHEDLFPPRVPHHGLRLRVGHRRVRHHVTECRLVRRSRPHLQRSRRSRLQSLGSGPRRDGPDRPPLRGPEQQAQDGMDYPTAPRVRAETRDAQPGNCGRGQGARATRQGIPDRGRPRTGLRPPPHRHL